MKFVLDDTDQSMCGSQYTLDYFATTTGLSPEAVEYGKFAMKLRENALRCLEAVGALAESVRVGDISLDVENTRVHLLGTLEGFLGDGGVLGDNDFAGALACMRLVCDAERKILAESLATFKEFLVLSDGIQSYVNAEVRASEQEMDVGCAMT
jgi:hypothetical protein